MTTYEVGQRVVLIADPDEGWEEEHGVIVGDSGPTTLIVGVDPPHRDGPDDDGLREVTPDQIREA